MANDLTLIISLPDVNNDVNNKYFIKNVYTCIVSKVFLPNVNNGKKFQVFFKY